MQPCPGCGIYTPAGNPCGVCAPLLDAQWRAQQTRLRAAEAPLREAERANDHAMWELSKRDFDCLTQGELETLRAWSRSFTPYTGSARLAYEEGHARVSYDDLVRAVDTKTTRSIERFLRQASRIPSVPVEVSQRKVTMMVRDEPRGLFRIRGRAPEVTRTIGDKQPGYRVFSWLGDAGTLEGPSIPRSQDLYVMLDGTMRLHGGYQYGQVRKCGRPDQPGFSVLWQMHPAGYGQLPGFLSPSPLYIDYGPLIPGLPQDITALQKTAAWLDEQLRGYLAAQR
jgi:hypothetical protein